MSDVIFEGHGLKKSYRTGKGKTLTACAGVDFSLFYGETLGIVGESGCGKSTLLRMAAQLERPDSGRLLFEGADITHLAGERLRHQRRNVQMVFQDSYSSFFPRMKAFDAIAEPIKNFYHPSRQELCDRVRSLLAMVGLPEEFADRYPHFMSGGQRQRLAIARALALNPRVLLCDEATASLDVSSQSRIVKLLLDIQRRTGLSVIFVCHDLALVQSVAHRIMVMYLGKVVEELPCGSVLSAACHPYTRALLESVFSVDMDFSKGIKVINGDIPSPAKPPVGCVFSTRCPDADTVCRSVPPRLTAVFKGHRVACHRFAEKA